jgi:hypothetical protein
MAVCFIALSFYRNIACQNRSSDEGLKEKSIFLGLHLAFSPFEDFLKPLMAKFGLFYFLGSGKPLILRE